MRCNFGAVIHHVHPVFYEQYYDGFSVTPQIRQHQATRHWASKTCAVPARPVE